MIIHKMTAGFGVLKDAALTLDPGLNVIEAPNESGKTTWCAFLRTMLYGPDQRRGREARSLEKRYAPWDGSPMYGEMEFSWGGREITLRRFDTSAGALRGFSAVYTGTNMAVSDLDAADPGEQLTGMSREVFERTAFIESGGLRVGSSQELEKKIAALVTSGEEGPTYTEAAEQLRALQRRCRYHGKGLLPGLEQEMEALSDAMDQIRDITEELEKLDVREEALEKIKEEDRDGKEQQQPVITAQQKALDLNLELLAREQEYSRLVGELRRGPFRGKEPGEELKRTVQNDHRLARNLEGRLKKKSGRGKLWLVLLALGILMALGGIFVRGLLLSAGIVLAGSAAAYILSGREDTRVKQRLEGLLRKYAVKNPADIPRAYERYAAQWRESRAIRAAAAELRVQSREAGEQIRSLKRTDDSAARQESAADETDRELRSIAENRARLLGRLDALGDLSEMKSRYDNLDAERVRLEKEYAALELALSELTAADEEMHTRFAPALSRTAEGIFRCLTGGRYSHLTFDKDLSAAARVRGETLPRPDRYLSRGTRDQLYLSLRLALCDLMAGEEPCPIILDDALVTFDDERLGLALDYLRELAQRRQVILFTCQDRENRWLNKV